MGYLRTSQNVPRMGALPKYQDSLDIPECPQIEAHKVPQILSILGYLGHIYPRMSRGWVNIDIQDVTRVGAHRDPKILSIPGYLEHPSMSQGWEHIMYGAAVVRMQCTCDHTVAL